MKFSVIIAFLCFTFWAQAQNTTARVIEVMGEATRSVEADELRIQLHIVGQGTELERVQAEMENKARDILRLLGANQSVKRIETQSVDFRKNWNRQSESFEYQARQSIQFSLSEPQKFTAISGQLVASAVDDYRIVGRSLNNQESTEMRLYEEAYDQALAKARLLAKRAGLELGKAVEISERSTPTVSDNSSRLLNSIAGDAATGPMMVHLRQSLWVRFEAQ